MFSTRTGAAKLALATVFLLIVFKGIVAFITGSISITAQAVDSFLDLFIISVIGFVVIVANRPADEEHPFGHGKIEGIAAIAQAVFIVGAAGVIIYSSIRRIISHSAPEMTETGMAVMLVSVIVSILLSRHLRRVAAREHSIALEAYAQNIAADVYSAAGVLVALIIIRFTGFSIIDPIVAMIVSIFMFRAGYGVLKASFGELVDVRLPKEEEDEIIACFAEHSHQLVGFHEVRTRRAGSQRFIDLHLMMPRDVSLEEAHEMCDHLEEDIKSRLANSSVTIHVEPCDEECDGCLVDPCTLREVKRPGRPKRQA